MTAAMAIALLAAVLFGGLAGYTLATIIETHRYERQSREVVEVKDGMLTFNTDITPQTAQAVRDAFNRHRLLPRMPAPPPPPPPKRCCCHDR